MRAPLSDHRDLRSATAEVARWASPGSPTRSSSLFSGAADGDTTSANGTEHPPVESPRIEPTADVDERAKIGAGTTVWHLAQVRENACLGRGCIVGRGAYVGPGVLIGDNVKLQNYALVYEPAVLEDGVFIGPAAVLTNDMYPRATDLTGKTKARSGLGSQRRGRQRGRLAWCAGSDRGGRRDRTLGSRRRWRSSNQGCYRLRAGRRRACPEDRLGRPSGNPP